MTIFSQPIIRTLLFSAAIAFAPHVHADGETEHYEQVVRSIDEKMHAYHYDPAELETREYTAIQQALLSLARNTRTDESFLAGFKQIWRNGPFSHVNLNKAQGSAEDLALYLDTMDVGGSGAELTWRDSIAILTVNTMMGVDTIRQIDEAYNNIAERGADGLIIDLRNNEGGAFAVRPLVEHLISNAFLAGAFVSQRWNAANDGPPNADDMTKIKPWDGWSVRRFWADAQAHPLTIVQFTPVAPVFHGPVYILTSERTASAAELAADALKSTRRATIVGETTAGRMLSQKVFDVKGGFQLFLPIADYYSAVHGRIEGNGVKPDMLAPNGKAMEIAIRHLKS